MREIKEMDVETAETIQVEAKAILDKYRVLGYNGFDILDVVRKALQKVLSASMETEED